MRTVGIVPNYDKEAAMELVKDLVEFLKSKDCKPVLTYNIAELTGLKEIGVSKFELYSKSEFILVLGGDGTLLDTGRKAAKYGTPLLGINMGTMGFLASADGSDANETIVKVLNNEYKLEKRLMLESEITSESDTPKTYNAVNDVCITRGVFTKITSYSIFVNDEYVATFRADGIIISTPTGSTAYNLSAGGPVLKPDISCMVITPICAHSLHSRSIVVSADDVIRVEASFGSNGDIIMSMDGQTSVILNNGDSIKIRKSEHSVNIIKTNKMGFYDILRRKLISKGE
ncbi:MAG: NAD(+)/NADH kinase [Candidatus Metalachnospira sp.]|nr:NAD(+)/NADH kinase [Candidatus Metalachnospira sp.]